jgi:hypothetical protein
MNQWDPSFGRRIICKKPTEERDPAAKEKRMGTRSTLSSTSFAEITNNQRAPQREERQFMRPSKMLRATHYAGSIATDPEVMFQ